MPVVAHQVHKLMGFVEIRQYRAAERNVFKSQYQWWPVFKESAGPLFVLIFTAIGDTYRRGR